MEKSKILTTRVVRSFVVRNGRITSGQSKALQTLLPKYQIDFQSTPVDWAQAFSRKAPMWVEIGFGNGIQTAKIAETHPEINILGVEVHLPGVGQLLNLVEQKALSNVRIIRHDAVEVIEQCIADDSLDRVLLFFPDPWPKTKHHKRRIVQKEFIATVTQKLRPGGIFHLATDWREYAKFMLGHLSDSKMLENLSHNGAFVQPPDYRLCTKFERRGINKGHGVWDLLFQKMS